MALGAYAAVFISVNLRGVFMKKVKNSTVIFVRPTMAQLNTIEGSYSIFAQRPRFIAAVGVTVHDIIPIFNLRRLEPRRS